MVLNLPKNPKLDDLLAIIEELDEAVTTLEAYVEHNTGRLAAIEELQHFAAEHQAGANQRQAEIDQLKAEINRQAWLARTGRKR